MQPFLKSTRIATAFLLVLVSIGAAGTALAQYGLWENRAPMPTARYGAAAGVIDGKLYVAGGWNGASNLTTLEVYDPATDTWTTKAPMPTARNDVGGAVIDGKFYVVGGGTSNQKYSNLEVYDPATDTWTTKAPMAAPRSSPAVGVIDGKLYVAGGCQGWCAPVTNVVEVYDPATNSWTSKAFMPTGRGSAATAVDDGLFYVMGGCCGWTGPQSESMARTIEVFDPTANSWSSRTQHVIGSDDTAGPIDGKIYLGKTNATEAYDPVTDSWDDSLATLPGARYNTAGGVIDGKLYVAGGTYDYTQPTNVLEVFTPDKDLDGVVDDLDAFPDDPAASEDTDGDGYPDLWNAGATAQMIADFGLWPDAFPEDTAATLDSDVDVRPDEWNDAATAGVIAASSLALDVYPNDPAASEDTDGDGYPDQWNVGATAQMIADFGLWPDAFPDDTAASEDTDGDGYPDQWNDTATADMIAASGLVLDAFPDDPQKWLSPNPTQPVPALPANASMVDTLTPTLKVTRFVDPYGDTHFKSHWQISGSATAAGFEGSVLFDLESETNLTALLVPDALLEPNRTYYWRVRFTNDNQHASPWSACFAFSTPVNSADSDGDGIEEEFEITTPVDLDADGVDDNAQADIKCVKTKVGNAQAGVKISTGVIAVEQLKPVDPAQLPKKGKPANLPYGLLSFRLRVTPGADAEVKIYFSKSLPTGAKWHKYDLAGGWRDFSANASLNAARTAVTLQLQDGGIGDADGVVNGIIVDPSGPADPATSGGGGGGGGGCFIDTVQ
jgi:N-acetylneuraminic acid mutarotase